jgi:hypothetical protein
MRFTGARLRVGDSLFNLQPAAMSLRPRRLSSIAAALFGLMALAPGAARADSLAVAETRRLERGETVTREQTVDAGDHHYVGGVTYTIVRTSPAELSSMLDDVEAYRRVLPFTKRAKIVGRDPGGDRLVELVQGTALVEAEYTIRVRQEPSSRSGRREVRFWLEPSRRHEIDDAWGYFRIEPFTAQSGEQQVLLTYAILVDVGPGIVRDLFEERIRMALLSVPQLVRRYVAEGRHPGY